MSDYYTLITALPWLEELETCKQLPLSRIALQQRLSMLSDPDREQLELIERLYHPRSEELEHLTDKDVVQRWQAMLTEVEDRVVAQRIAFHWELRTLLAALRSRESGMEEASYFYGLGRWMPRIRKHWFEPLFGLEEVFPALLTLDRVQKKKNPHLLERQLNRILWQDLRLAEHQSYFSFTAVACFVLRWGLAERHIQYNGERAVQQFDQATAALLSSCQLAERLPAADRRT